MVLAKVEMKVDNGRDNGTSGRGNNNDIGVDGGDGGSVDGGGDGDDSRGKDC